MDASAQVKAMPAVDAAIGRALEEQRIVGAVVLIARDGNIAYAAPRVSRIANAARRCASTPCSVSPR